MSYGDIAPTPAELSKGGAVHRAMAIYMDRFVDPESGDVDTFQRFATCGFMLADGTKGYLSSGVCLKAYGITLTLDGGTEVTETAETTTAAEATADTETAKDSSTVNNKDSSTTTKAKATTKKATTSTTSGGNAAQTFDLGVAAAIGAAVVAVIAFIFVKKKLK